MYASLWKKYHGLLKSTYEIPVYSPENYINLALVFLGANGPKVQ